jgi:hypothetical protein
MKQASHDESCRSSSDERIGTGACHALAPLPFQAHETAHQNGEEKAECELCCRYSDHDLEPFARALCGTVLPGKTFV